MKPWPKIKPRPSRPSLLPDTDCEDQGFSLLSDGCLACLPEFVNDKPVYPALVKRNVNGRWYWYCPRQNSHGSYGEVQPNDIGGKG